MLPPLPFHPILALLPCRRGLFFLQRALGKILHVLDEHHVVGDGSAADPWAASMRFKGWLFEEIFKRLQPLLVTANLYTNYQCFNDPCELEFVWDSCARRVVGGGQQGRLVMQQQKMSMLKANQRGEPNFTCDGKKFKTDARALPQDTDAQFVWGLFAIAQV